MPEEPLSSFVLPKCVSLWAGTWHTRVQGIQPLLGNHCAATHCFKSLQVSEYHPEIRNTMKQFLRSPSIQWISKLSPSSSSKYCQCLYHTWTAFKLCGLHVVRNSIWWKFSIFICDFLGYTYPGSGAAGLLKPVHSELLFLMFPFCV